MSLANYDWKRDWETERKRKEPSPDKADKRNPFEHDRSRIIHGVAFRRLQGKTQIFAPGWADFMRTRVTHAIEVAQIGRALAENAGIPGSLVEAACLAHDLGHPPFGHTGELALNELMEKHGGFEGNAQTFRILQRLEKRTTLYDGLNLSRATLLGVLKYPYRRSAGREKFLYEEDAAEYEEWLFKGSEYALLASKGNLSKDPPRTIACQLMDWADDVAYSVHDLEDGVVSGFLIPQSFSQGHFIDSVSENLRKAPIRWKSGRPPSRESVKDILTEVHRRLSPKKRAPSQGTIREVTRYYINRFVTRVQIESPKSATNSFDFSLNISEDLRVECSVLKAVTFEFVIRDERTTTFVFKGREIVRRIFEALSDNTDPAAGRSRFELFPRVLRPELEQASDNQSDLARLVCDYIASMTDGQAIRLYRRFFEPTASSPFEPV